MLPTVEGHLKRAKQLRTDKTAQARQACRASRRPRFRHGDPVHVKRDGASQLSRNCTQTRTFAALPRRVG